MATILDLQENLKQFNIEVVAKQTIAATSNIMADYNKKQLKEGFNSKQQRLIGYKHEKYAIMKNQMNSKPGKGNPDLFLTGAFHSALHLEVSDDTFQFIDDDSKAIKLIDMYGDDIFGLTEENKDTYSNDVVLPLIQDEFIKVTGLTFN